MEKHVLVLYYTQTGQLSDIVDSFSQPLQDAGVTVEKALIKVKNNYPFPWTSDNFFNEMPESVLGIPTELLPFEKGTEPCCQLSAASGLLVWEQVLA